MSCTSILHDEMLKKFLWVKEDNIKWKFVIPNGMNICIIVIYLGNKKVFLLVLKFLFTVNGL